jgi:hypothetical protein
VAPLDEALGLGPGTVSPGLTRVVARATVETAFAPTVEQVQETLGATLSDETARRRAEQIGAVAEAQTQAAIARAQQGPLLLTPAFMWSPRLRGGRAETGHDHSAGAVYGAPDGVRSVLCCGVTRIA